MTTPAPAFPLIQAVARAAWEEIVMAPVWWYGRGLRGAFKRFLMQCKNNDRAVGWSVWLRNLFVPMYGQQDLTGRFISVVVRMILLIARTVMIVILDAFSVLFFALYLLLPLLALWGIVLALRALLI